MKRLVVALVAAAGCGGSSSNSDGGHDFSTRSDLAAPADLSEPPDLSALPDLVTLPDLATLPDLTKPAKSDLAGVDAAIKCPANMGFVGMNTCGEGGSCDGRKFSLDCDGVNCTCSIDGVSTLVFPQNNACQNIDGAWMNQCMY